MFTIRTAALSDAEGVAFVHVESWKTTYKGLLSDTLIASRTLERRIEQWSRQLATPNPARVLFVAEDAGRIVGYVQLGPTRTPDLPYTHELYAIYTLAEVQGRGLGRALFNTGVQWLRDREVNTMMLWVLEGNLAARGFYERMGGQMVTRRIDPDFTEPVSELAYGWHSLNFAD